MRVAIALLATWSLVLTVLVLALAREVGLLAAARRPQPGLEGRPLLLQESVDPRGSAILEEHVKPQPGDEAYIIWLSAQCTTCLAASASIRDGGDDDRVRAVVRRSVALVNGQGRTLRPMVTDLESGGCAVIDDPAASEIAAALRLPGTPMALAVRDGVVTGWTDLPSIDRLVALRRANQLHTEVSST